VGPISVDNLLAIIRAKGEALPQRLALHLFCGAVWRAAVAGASLRPRMIVLDPAEGLRLDLASRGDDSARESGYVAPEARTGSPGDDPQVLVYAAGALGYELLCGDPPPPPPVQVPPHISGPLGKVLRTALAPQRPDRFTALDQMSDALQAIQPAPGPELEKLLFTALHGLGERWKSEPSRPEPGWESDGSQETAALFKWTAGIEAAVEQMQRQQLELMVALAGAAEKSGGSAEREATQRTPVRARSPLWMVWTGAALSGVVGALLVVAALGRTSAPVAPEVRIAQARPLPAPEPSAAPAPPPAPAPEPPRTQAMVAMPMILSAAKQQQPAEKGGGAGSDSDRAAAEPAKETPVEHRSAPPHPPPAAAKRAKRPASTTRALLDFGERALSRGQPEDALTAFTSALAADPTLARAVRGTAMAQMMQGMNREAKESFQQYLLLDPNADDALQIQKVIQSLDVEASR